MVVMMGGWASIISSVLLLYSLGIVKEHKGQSSMDLIHQTDNQGYHPVGNKGMGNSFEQGKLIILEEVEGHEIKVRQTT